MTNAELKTIHDSEMRQAGAFWVICERRGVHAEPAEGAEQESEWCK